jgi:hypothetical protein
VASLSPNPAAMSRAKLINGVFDNARFGVGLNLHVVRQAGEGEMKPLMLAGTFRNSSSAFISAGSRHESYAISSRR